MKLNYILTIAIVGAIQVSCSTVKQTASAQESKSDQPKDTYDTYAENVGISESDGTGTNGTGGAMNNLQAKDNFEPNNGYDYDQLFVDLNMTDEQILQFRKGVESFQSRRVNSPNGEMLGTIEDERERQLQNILTEEQLRLYRSRQ